MTKYSTKLIPVKNSIINHMQVDIWITRKYFDKLITKHGNEDCASYAEVTLWEFAVYTDIVSQPSTDQDNDGINDSLDYCLTRKFLVIKSDN